MRQNNPLRCLGRGVLDLFLPRGCIYTGERLGGRLGVSMFVEIG